MRMTFDEAHTAIKKGDMISLRHALDAGMTPDLSNPSCGKSGIRSAGCTPDRHV